MNPHEADVIEAAERRKAEIRRTALAARRTEADKALLSRRITERVLALPEFAAAQTVMSYVSTADEVDTTALIRRCWADGKRVVTSYCGKSDLHLFLLTDFSNLAPGTMGILEPRRELRGTNGHAVDPLEIELALVPGVAFDRRGGRLGFGKGYYDRFLIRLGPFACTVGLAFECQLFDRVPLLTHDVVLHKLVTDSTVYEQQPLL